MTLAQFPKNKLFKNHDTVLMKKLWIFFPEMTLAQFPKSDFFIFRWIFFPKMTLAQFPIFGFFFQDSRIGVKGLEYFFGDIDGCESHRETFVAIQCGNSDRLIKLDEIDSCSYS